MNKIIYTLCLFICLKLVPIPRSGTASYMHSLQWNDIAKNGAGIVLDIGCFLSWLR